MIGQTISHYKITAKLGEGGMGVVYKAEDTKLERTVALKFLAAHLLQDEEARKRFVREAKAAAALSHPHICTVHEIDQAEGRTFIAMAYVEGQNLDAKIAAGPLKLNEILDLARQVAEGLQEAHSHGIYHRDVKPQNILISTKSGSKQHATIMDFGLAHLTEQSKLTQKDTSLGTVAYMSPEQTMGAEVDQRTDIWALGCVIYEMVCGGQPFKGHYAQAVTYSILNEEPEPLTALRTGLPMELEWIVGKCLAKDADSRYQNASELAVDLKNLQDKLKSGRSTIRRTSMEPGVSPVTSLAQPPPERDPNNSPVPADAVPRLKRKLLLYQSVFAFTAVAALALAFAHFREESREIPLTELSVELPAGARLHTYSLSPDGRHVALALGQSQGGRRLWVRSLDTLEPRELAGTEGATHPFWSPDSHHIGFFADGKLKKVALTGGPPQSLCDAEDGRGGTWNTAGVIVFAPSAFSQIQRVADGGGEPAAVTIEDEPAPGSAHRFPSFLPDGRHFFYTVSNAGPERVGIYLGSIDGTEPRRLLADESKAVYARESGAESGFVLFSRENILMAQPFELERSELVGDALPIVDPIPTLSQTANYGFSISTGGSLLYVRSGGERTAEFELNWVDRAGKIVKAMEKPLRVLTVSLSPDDRRAALSVWDGPMSADIWLLEFARGTMSRLTTDPGGNFSSQWSHDGQQIVFSSRAAGGGYGIYRKDSGGATGEETLLTSADSAAIGRNIFVTDWSRDARLLLFEVQRPRRFLDIWVLPLEGERKPYAFLESEFEEYDGRFSPDGRWVSYTSNESGRMEVYVRPFPAADRKWQISTQGGTAAVWSKNGRELYYIDRGGKLMAVALQTGDTLEASAPDEILQTTLTGGTYAAYGRYAVSSDGRFLIANRIGDEQQDDQRKLILVSDWRAKVGK